MGYIVKYEGTIFANPANRYCIVSVKTSDTTVPAQARDKRRYRDHLIHFTAVGYNIPMTDAVELEGNGWTESTACSSRWSSAMRLCRRQKRVCLHTWAPG